MPNPAFHDMFEESSASEALRSDKQHAEYPGDEWENGRENAEGWDTDMASVDTDLIEDDEGDT